MYLSQLLLRPDVRDTWAWLGDCHRLHQVVMSGFRNVESEQARKDLGVLFRVEPGATDGFVRVLVQSKEVPDWSGVESRALVRPVEQAKDLAPLEARIQPGTQFRFRLRANPTRRVHRRAAAGGDDRELTRDGRWLAPEEITVGERTGIVRRIDAEKSQWVGKRVDLRREEERLAWLARRGGEHDGFELRRVALAPALDSSFLVPQSGTFSTRADSGGPLLGRKKVERRSGGAVAVDRRLTFGTALFEGILEVRDRERFLQALRNGIGPGKAFGCGLLSVVPISQV